MSKPIALVAILAAAAATSACSTIQRSMGVGRNAPDEFRVVTSAPLALPPEYSLRPPRPGEQRPQELQPDAEARSVLFGQDVGAQASTGERLLVNSAGAEASDPNIRDTIDYEAQGIVRRNEGFVNRLLSFQGAEAEASTPLDAEGEARRLEDQESIRRTTGGGAVTIQRDAGGFKLPGT